MSNFHDQLPFEIVHPLTFRDCLTNNPVTCQICPPTCLSKSSTHLLFEIDHPTTSKNAHPIIHLPVKPPPNYLSKLPVKCPHPIIFRNRPPNYLQPITQLVTCQICPATYLSKLPTKYLLKCTHNNPITCHIYPPNSSITCQNFPPNYLSKRPHNYLSQLSTQLPFEIVHPITFKIPNQ